MLQSAASVRRQTHLPPLPLSPSWVTIRCLRAEADLVTLEAWGIFGCYNPLPPCGGRPLE